MPALGAHCECGSYKGAHRWRPYRNWGGLLDRADKGERFSSGNGRRADDVEHLPREGCAQLVNLLSEEVGNISEQSILLHHLAFLREREECSGLDG